MVGLCVRNALLIEERRCPPPLGPSPEPKGEGSFELILSPVPDRRLSDILLLADEGKRCALVDERLELSAALIVTGDMEGRGEADCRGVLFSPGWFKEDD